MLLNLFMKTSNVQKMGNLTHVNLDMYPIFNIWVHVKKIVDMIIVFRVHNKIKILSIQE